MMQNMDKIKDCNSDIDKIFQDTNAVMQKMNNELVTLKRQQAQGSGPFHANC